MYKSDQSMFEYIREFGISEEMMYNHKNFSPNIIPIVNKESRAKIIKLKGFILINFLKSWNNLLINYKSF